MEVMAELHAERLCFRKILVHCLFQLLPYKHTTQYSENLLFPVIVSLQLDCDFLDEMTWMGLGEEIHICYASSVLDTKLPIS